MGIATTQGSSAQSLTLVPTMSTYAGSGATASNGDGGLATAAAINNPEGIAYDGKGNTYIADYGGNRIRVINAAGVISNAFGPVAGGACANPTATTGACGDGGAASAATFNNPCQMQFDSAGSLYITDKGDNRIRKITAVNGAITGASIISTVAGTGTAGTTGDGALATAAQLNNPHGLVLDRLGNLYIDEQAGAVIRKVVLSTGKISTFVGVPGNGTGYGGDGGQANVAAVKLSAPTSLAVDTANNLYIGDYQNGRVRKVTVSTNVITTVVGTGYQACATVAPTAAAPNPIPACGDGGQASAATLGGPTGIYLDASNNLYIGDATGARVREVFASTGIITTIAGTSQECNNINQTVQNPAYPTCGDGGPATSALVSFPILVSISPQGNLQFVDQYDNKIRESLSNIVFPNTNVGSSSPSQNVLLQVSGAATQITSITVPVDANGTPEYIVGTITGCNVGAGTAANTVGTVCSVPVTFNPAYTGTQVQPLVAVTNGGTFSFGMTGTGVGPQAILSPGTLSTLAGTGVATTGTPANGTAASTTLSGPTRSYVDLSGNVFIADTSNNVVRVVYNSGSSVAALITIESGVATPVVGTMYTLAGTGTACAAPTASPACGDGSQATAATLNAPTDVTLDSNGNLFISDSGDNRVREVNVRTGVITTVAGNGAAAYSADGVSATTTGVGKPVQSYVDTNGDIYVLAKGDHALRYIPEMTGPISTIAGTEGSACATSTAACGDGGLATSAQLNAPNGFDVDVNGNVYIADTGDNRIRLVNVVTGIISTVAGTGTAGFSGEGAAATSANLNAPWSVTLDADDDFFIADRGNEVIRAVFAGAGNVIHTIAGIAQSPCTSATAACGDGGSASVAAFLAPSGVVFDGPGNLYVTDSTGNKVRKLLDNPTSLTFPSTAVGNTSSLTSNLLNIGNAALTLNVPSSGTNPSVSAGFNLGNNTTCAQLTTSSSAAGTLAAGSSCLYGINFAPASGPGTYTGKLIETDNSLNSGAGNTTYPNALTQTINLNGVATQATASVALTSSVNPTTYGQSTTFTVTVSGVAGTPTATNGIPLSYTPSGSTTAVSLGTATATATAGVYTLTTAVLPVGTDNVVATYGGDTNYIAGTPSNTVAQVVNKAVGTGDTLAANPTTTAFGSPVTLTFTIPTVAGATASPTGTVTFTNGTTNLGTATLTTTGTGANAVTTATLTTSTLPVGTDTVTATYPGDTNYAAASPTATETVTQAAPTASLAASPATGDTYGAPVVLSETVTPINGVCPTTTVAFASGGVTLGTTTFPATPSGTPAKCVASITTTVLPVGNDTITATAPAGGNFGAISSTTTETVAVASGANDTLVANPTTSNFGSPVTLTFTVPTVAGAAASPTGTVTFTSGGVTLGTGTLTTTGTGATAVTTATITTSTLPVGTDTITANYPGNTNYGSGSATATETVGLVSPTASLTASPATGDTYGSPVVLTETVTAVNGVCPTSTVSFVSGGVTLGTATFPATPTGTPATCTATITTTALPVGNDTITASAPAGGNYAAISSSTTETVALSSGANDKLTANPTSSAFGSPVVLTFTVPTVTGASASPTGTVTFTSGGVTLGTATLSTTGTGANAVTTATLTTSKLPVGTDTVTAAYPGDANYAAANPSPTATETVTQATPTASLAASPTTGDTYGSPVVLTETVTAINGLCPTSTVTFASGGVTLGTATFTGTPAANPTTCTATITSTALPVGNDTITATAPATGNFGAISSSTTETVATAPGTGDTLTANPTTSSFGSSVVLTFTVPTVAGATASPTGTITFSSGGVTLGTATLTTTGTGSSAVTTATLTTASLPVGTDTVTATYPGNANYASGSATATETVTPAAATASLTASPATGVTYGSPVVLTETVAAINGVCPTSTVTFASGGVTLGTGTFTGTPAANPTSCTTTITTTALPVGNDTITATAPAAGNFGAISSSISETVAAASGASDTLAANPTSTAYGSPVTLTFTVPTVAGAAAPPTGTVTFSNGATTLGTATLTTTGTGANAVTTATLTTSALPVGTDTVTAIYPGNANYAAANPAPTATVTVGQVTPTASLSASPATGATYGSPVVLTETVAAINGACPTSTVTFASGGITLGTANFPATPSGNPSSCVATITTAALPVGTDTITATAPAAGSFGAISSSTSETIAVASGANDTLTANPTSSTFGSPVQLTFTVPTVAGASAPPTGTVTFTSGGVTLGTATLTTVGSGANATTTATLNTSSLPVGTDTVTATYPGNANYAAASPAPTAVETVNPASVTGTLSATPATGDTFGSPVTLTETISPINGVCPTATVTFASGGATLGTSAFTGTPAANPTSCVATITTTALPVGTDTITATAPASGSFAAISSSTSETVSVASGANDTLTANPTSAAFGSTVTLTFTVPTVAGASASPTGTVTFTSGGVTLGTATLTTTGTGANAVTTATLTTSALPVGTDTVTATYPGNANYGAATPAPTATVTITQGASNGTLTASPATGDTYGGLVTLTESVTPINGTCPTAPVTFTSNGSTLGTATFPATPTGTPAACIATLTTTALPVGTDTITATAPAAGSFGPISSSTTETVGTASGSGDTLTANPTTSSFGSPVTLTFTIPTIAGASASPTGTVTFASGGITLGTGTLSTTNGVTTATLTTSALPVGTDTITATYTGNTNYSAGSATATETVNPVTSTGTLTASPATGDTFGMTVTLTETIAPVNGVCPTATVTFASGGVTLGTATFVGSPVGNPTSCIATSTTTALPVGTDTITATAPAAGSFGPISSSTTETVAAASGASDTLTANPTTSAFGSPVVLTFTVPAVAGASAQASGTVTFTSGNTTLGTGTLGTTNGVTTATLTTSALPVGTDTVTATYAGNGSYGPASPTATVTVSQATSNGTLTASPASGDLFGMTVTLTETIAPINGVCPVSTVTFSSGGVTLGTGTFSPVPATGTPTSCVAKTTTTALPVGTDTITATAPAAGSFGPISSSTTETVGAAAATGVLTAQTPAGGTYGSPVTLTETVAPINGICPTGVVTFSDGGVTLGTGSFTPVPATGTPTSCVASLTTTALPSGASTVTATYPGNGNFGPITSTISVTLAPASAGGDTLTATPATAVVGTPVTLTFTIPAVAGAAVVPSGTVTFSSGGVTLGTGTVTTVNGVSSATIATTVLPVGADTVTATYTGNASYGAATLTTVVAVTPNDFAIAATPPTQTVNPGDSATYTVSLSGLVVPFNSPVTLTATGLPPGATVTFAKPTYVPGAGPTSTTMTIVTSPTQAMLKQSSKGSNGIYYGLLLLPLLGLGSVRRKVRSIPNGISYCLAALLLLCGTGMMTGCGGGYFGPAPKTYTITVTGTSTVPSGTLTHSTTVTLEIR